MEKQPAKTALSQRRNLLFVAYSHQIYVWEPAGSFQTLGSKPEMKITPVMKEPHSDGYISPATPHAINNILVDDLGREEVLLLVTDSGNVCGYRVEAIYSALKRAAESRAERPLDGSQVDPFFVEYVDASAWGLAIHKFARLIAVSANTGLITVFAFALVNPASTKSDNSDHHYAEDEGAGDGDFTDYGQTWLQIRNNDQFAQLRHLMPDKHRTRNVKLTYTGHFSNIPSISFLNCDLDPNGTWMVSTDIDNKLLVWKIWESLGPFNVYHFNDITFKSFPQTLRNDERGWSVIALDPRTFHLVKSTEQACGGQPQRRLKNGQAVLDLTKLRNRVPNASHLYNYFPPAAKTEPDQAVLPDIFDADCCINSSSTAHHQFSDNPSASNVTMPDAHQPNTDTRNLRPSNSADTFSHRAVDGSVRDNLSYDSGSDEDMDVQHQPTPSQHSGLVGGNRILQTLEDSDEPSDNAIIQGGPGPLTTPEFLQFALLEALGGDIPEAEEYFGEYALDEDTDGLFMVDAEGDSSDDDMSPAGAVYQVLDPPMNANFPILHFSQTDIRLIPHPFAPHASVVCGEPLRQPFTHPITSIRACDRFNMVKYIPEHGIVVAASQKGRAAIIALTESKDTGLTFRLDWVVPFESQEKYGDRPLIPLLGMSVSPIQGFEMPPDVPYIPRAVSDSHLSFHYRPTTEGDTSSQSGSSAHRPGDDANASSELGDRSDSSPSTPMLNPRDGSLSDTAQQPPLTLPECHAKATRAYQPEERWRGWNPSRRYRLLLMYADHTVMSYEFWYNWSSTETSADESEDDYLVV
ncbi:pyridine nucleotide-disulfide oxidoreductase family protein [Aspergillus terreus]|uniref:Pyridine nucleotide-disulfide oxidoreductase family protein n=1 Tax=Aspergillus terreus TaxID=33178 RepID=A0A5M3Z2H9_ASPTE|nr:hypothetical protein ATETN484_0008020300 [Aspergillus terreus]GFF21104.1 pyridine nucleotide-disulfide oxidoreductase family protein [Aspergillus terreus]